MYKSSNNPWEHCSQGYAHTHITSVPAIKNHVHPNLGLDSIREQEEAAVDRGSNQSILAHGLRACTHEYLCAKQAKNEF